MKHYIATLLILLLGAGAHWSISHAQDTASRNQAETVTLEIPDYIGGYSQQGPDEEVDERTKRILETSTVMIRNYASESGWPVQLTIVYAGTTRRSLHFPEICLVGAGWEIREQYLNPVGFDFWAKRLVLVKGKHQQAVVYWFKTGDNLTGNYFENAWEWAKNQVSFGTRTSAMIKLSAPIGSAGEEAAFAMLDDFAMKFVPILMENVS